MQCGLICVNVCRFFLGGGHELLCKDLLIGDGLRLIYASFFCSCAKQMLFLLACGAVSAGHAPSVLV